jgi:hypothetical protein
MSVPALKAANYTGAGNGAGALSFHVGHLGRELATAFLAKTGLY